MMFAKCILTIYLSINHMCMIMSTSMNFLRVNNSILFDIKHSHSAYNTVSTNDLWGASERARFPIPSK